MTPPQNGGGAVVPAGIDVRRVKVAIAEQLKMAEILKDKAADLDYEADELRRKAVDHEWQAERLGEFLS